MIYPATLGVSTKSWNLPWQCSRVRFRHASNANKQKGTSVSVGPVQLVVLGFDSPNFQGEIIDEFNRLRHSNTVRIIDSLLIYKDSDGSVEVVSATNLNEEEQAEFGGYVAALLGLDERTTAELSDSVEGMQDEEDIWDVVDEIPNDTAAALVLLDHQWAVPLRDAIRTAGGFMINEGFINPLDLVDVGLMIESDAATY